MKKLLACVLSITACMCLMASCGGGNVDDRVLHQLHFRAGFRCQADHGKNILMKQRLTHTAKEDGLHGLWHCLQHPAVILQA